MIRSISYVMAPDDSFYSGLVLRRVTADDGLGKQTVLSETTTGWDLAEFQAKHPDEPVDGQRGTTLADELSYMSDEQLSKMGLSRNEGEEQLERPKKEEEVLEPTLTYPALTGHGWYMLSDGSKVKGKAQAKVSQALLEDQIKRRDEVERKAKAAVESEAKGKTEDF